MVINPAFEEIFSQKKENVCGKLISQIFHDDDKLAQGWNRLFTKFSSPTVTSEFEHFMDFHGRWFRVNAWQSDDRNMILVLTDITEIKNKEKEPHIFLESVDNSSDAVDITSLVGVDADKTGRMEASTVLADSEFKYKSLVESSQDAIFVVDKNDYYQFVNNAFATTLGHMYEYFAGKSFWDIYPKDLADMRYEGVVKVFETGLPSEVEVVVPLPGKTLHYLAKTNPIKDGQGNVFQVLVTATDITARKHAEEKLLESEKRYEQIDSSSRDSIYAYDRQGRFIHANRALCRLLGRSREEIIGKTHAELGFPPAQCEEWQALHDEVYARGDTVIRETATPIQDGAVMYFEVILNPIAEQRGTIIGISGITRDITERKQAEEAIRERESLLRKIAENYPNSYLSIIEKDFTIGFTSGQEFKTNILTRNNLSV